MLVHFNIAVQFYVHVNVELYLHAFVQLYGEEKQVWWNGFILLLVRDIGADITNQIIPVKIMVVKFGIGLAIVIFYWYYLTGTIRTYIIIHT